MNKGFVEIMKRQFIELAKKAGIDISEVDLQNYDFSNYYSVHSLIRDYARRQDIICSKILMYLRSEEYGGYYGPQELKYDIDNEKDDDNEIHELKQEINIIKDEISNLLHKINEMSAEAQGYITSYQLTSSLEQIKQQINNIYANIRSEIDKITPVPTNQAKLGINDSIVKNFDKNNNNNNNNIVKRRKLIHPVRALMHIANASILATIINYITGFSWFLSYWIIFTIGLLDAIVWSNMDKIGTRGFASGYMYSQYSNPYK